MSTQNLSAYWLSAQTSEAATTQRSQFDAYHLRLSNAVMVGLGYHSMRQILYGLQNAARIEGANFSLDSFRVGGALDYLEAGMPIEKIMLKGGWHSGSTVIQYLRAWEDI